MIIFDAQDSLTGLGIFQHLDDIRMYCCIPDTNTLVMDYQTNQYICVNCNLRKLRFTYKNGTFVYTGIGISETNISNGYITQWIELVTGYSSDELEIVVQI